MTFEPEIIGFCCSWSGFHNSEAFNRKVPKDLGFKAELYPIECVGALPSFLVLDAIEKGIDGVFICTCGKDACQYFQGDEKIQNRIPMFEAMLEDLGLEPGRVGFEKVPDRDVDKFDKVFGSFVGTIRELGPNPMKGETKMAPGLSVWPPQDKKDVTAIEDLQSNVRAIGVLQCLECGKCTASCPVSKVKNDFSPMYIVEKALRSLDQELGVTMDIWNCLTCASCSNKCPSNVDFVEFVRYLRSQGTIPGEMCTHGGLIQSIARHHSRKENVQDRLSWVTDGLKVSDKGEVMYFTGCLSYFDVIFKDIGFKGTEEIARNTVQILNKAGITPVLMADERCCGHDAFWNGHTETFKRLAAINTEKIKAAGVKTIVTSCPECTRTFKVDYPKFTDLDVEVKHVTEFIADLIADGKIGFDEAKGEPIKVSYQDPCRLVRHLNIVDPPRRILEALPGVELVEMPSSRELAVCCGTSAWANCNAISEGIRAERVQEALRTGAQELVTSCPKCQIHFKCTMSAKPETRGIDRDIAIIDIVTMVAKSMRGE